MTETHKYEAKVWRENGTWAARLLRNGISWDYDSGFGSRDEALAWARNAAASDRAFVAAEARAERVPV